MKTSRKALLLSISGFLFQDATGIAAEPPPRVSIAPANDLTVLIAKVPTEIGFGSKICGVNLSKEYQQGYEIGARNNHYGYWHVLVLDDGKTEFAAIGKESGLPVIVLTNAKITAELQDMVRGYNSAMRFGARPGQGAK